MKRQFAERVLKIKLEKLLSENDLQLLIVDATEQRIERPKNQRDYYSGKAHACTIKTEVVIDPKGRILRVSKPYEGRVHDFKIRKTEGPLLSVPIFADSGHGITGEQAASMLSENNHTSKPDGHGIGMLIVRRVMREHNGFVEIESKKNTGSIIYLKLPLLEQSLKRLKCEQV